VGDWWRQQLPRRLNLLFTTAPHPGSLVGLTSGSIVGATSFVPSHYNNLSGGITPVPEPSSLLLLAGGIGWLVFGPPNRKLLLRALSPLRRRASASRVSVTTPVAGG